MQSEMRRRLALTLVLLVPLGIGTKFYAGPAAGWVRGHAGGILYVVFWTTAVALVLPSPSPWRVAGGVFFVTCGLEFLQLWRPPTLRTIRQTFLGWVLIGAAFDWWDLVHYGVGAVLGALLVRKTARATSDD